MFCAKKDQIDVDTSITGTNVTHLIHLLFEYMAVFKLHIPLASNFCETWLKTGLHRIRFDPFRGKRPVCTRQISCSSKHDTLSSLCVILSTDMLLLNLAPQILLLQNCVHEAARLHIRYSWHHNEVLDRHNEANETLYMGTLDIICWTYCKTWPWGEVR